MNSKLNYLLNNVKILNTACDLNFLRAAGSWRVFEVSGADLKDVKEMIGHTDLAMADRYAPLTNRHKQIRQDEFAKYYRDGMCYYETGYKFKV